MVSEESASEALVAALEKGLLGTRSSLDSEAEPGNRCFLQSERRASTGGAAAAVSGTDAAQKKKARRRDSAKLREADNCDEDGHSTLKKKKVRKVKRHCDIHSTNSRENLSMLEIDSVGNHDVKSRNPELVCTCHKRSKSKSRRPDPEGGPNVPPPALMDEFDKVIYNKEPLFSDTEENTVADDQVLKDMERYHKRVQNPDIFSAALMVNSNTLLKFAIIGTELQNISNTSLRRVMFLFLPWLEITSSRAGLCACTLVVGMVTCAESDQLIRVDVFSFFTLET